MIVVGERDFLLTARVDDAAVDAAMARPVFRW